MLPSWITDPLWDQFHALLPERIDQHPLGCHRPWIGDRIVFDKLHDPALKACVALQTQYIFDTFGKFPGTVPTLFILNYVQAHHLDLEFYDRFFKSGAYLPTHAKHMARWHGRPGEG